MARTDRWKCKHCGALNERPPVARPVEHTKALERIRHHGDKLNAVVAEELLGDANPGDETKIIARPGGG